jgi:CBS domain containing-hemolysin-like protein
VKTAIIFLLGAVYLISILLEAASQRYSLAELKRRSRGSHDVADKKIYQMVSYGQSLQLLIWIFSSVSLAALVIITAGISKVLAVLLVLVAMWLAVAGRSGQLDKTSWRVAASIAPAASWILAHLQPILNKFHRAVPGKDSHSRLYEKEDLVEALHRQAQQHDNRIDESDLALAKNALTFANKKVSDVMKDAKYVSPDDDIGPHLMDELHASGTKYYPVVEDKKQKPPKIIALLYLNDLINHPDAGRVAEVMKRSVHFIDDEQNLYQALEQMTDQQTHMLIVRNNFEEVAGVLSLEDILTHLLGKKEQVAEFVEPEPETEPIAEPVIEQLPE